MALHRRTVHRSEILAVHLVHCRPDDPACGPEECSPVNSVAFPLRGVFLKHHSRRERVVADGCHALFFRAGEPYRVSHPAGCGDDCLAIEPSPRTLQDVLGAEAFPHTHVLLDAHHIRASRILCQRLPAARSLEIEAQALELLAACAGSRPAPLATRRQQDMVEATRITLAAQPQAAWTLGELARRVHRSPFHLAHSFRRLAGMPLHRYHLRARLAAALDMVLDSPRDLTGIGLELGFSSHSHFTAAFHRTFGATPSALRNRARS
jgi:AraC-like DNA-binding protein